MEEFPGLENAAQFKGGIGPQRRDLHDGQRQCDRCDPGAGQNLASQIEPDQPAIFRRPGRGALGANDQVRSLAEIRVGRLLGQVGVGDGVNRDRVSPERPVRTCAGRAGGYSDRQ